MRTVLASIGGFLLGAAIADAIGDDPALRIVAGVVGVACFALAALVGWSPMRRRFRFLSNEADRADQMRCSLAVELGEVQARRSRLRGVTTEEEVIASVRADGGRGRLTFETCSTSTARDGRRCSSRTRSRLSPWRNTQFMARGGVAPAIGAPRLTNPAAERGGQSDSSR